MENRKLPYPGVWLHTSYGSVYARFKPRLIEVMTRPAQSFLIDGERGILMLEIKKNDAGKWVPQKLVVTQPKELDEKTSREVRRVLIREALGIVKDPVFAVEIERVTLHNMQVDICERIDDAISERNTLNTRIAYATDETTRAGLISEREAVTERIIASKEAYRELEEDMDTLLSSAY